MEIIKSLQEILASIPGASTIFLTDRDGVMVLSVGDELRTRSSLIASQQATFDQTGKLVMGAHLSSVFFYENSQLLILNVPPLTAYVVASPSSNTGLLLKLKEKLEPLLQQIESIIPDLPGGISDERMKNVENIHEEFDRRNEKDDGWEQLVEEKDLRVFRRRIAGPFEMYEYKCTGTYYDISPRTFLDAQNDIKYRSEWDRNIITLELLKEEGEHELIRWVARYPYPMYPREYVYARRTWVSEDNRTVVVDSEVLPSVQHSSLAGTRREYSVKYAVFGGSSYSNYFVRLSLPFNLDLWLFTNYKPNTTKTQKSDYILTYFDNPEANIPRYLYSWIVNHGGPYFLKQVHEAAREIERTGRNIKSTIERATVKRWYGEQPWINCASKDKTHSSENSVRVSHKGTGKVESSNVKVLNEGSL
uniref:START domain-containing protein n=1 Tax=Heterorhabditis bacteriophora TaxID=37862 RepID=A0A1I7XV65_HETBA